MVASLGAGKSTLFLLRHGGTPALSDEEFAACRVCLCLSWNRAGDVSFCLDTAAEG